METVIVILIIAAAAAYLIRNSIRHGIRGACTACRHSRCDCPAVPPSRRQQRCR